MGFNWWYVLGPIAGIGWVALLYYTILMVETAGQRWGK